ncbi:hypothetical protein ABBQ32_004415 [Trebouxia sp. C0010 RCD-2024]
MQTGSLQALAAGLGFTYVEHLLTRGPAGSYLESLFKSNKTLLASQIRPAVRQAATNMVGMLHVLIVVPLAIATLTDPRMIKDRLYNTSPTSTTMLAIASGYFVHDLVVCTKQLSTWGPAYLLHALFCSLLYCYGLLSGVLHYYGAMFLLWELSTPFVYTRWFLHKAGLSRTTAYKVNGALMVVVFFLCRNVAGLVCSIDFFRETEPELRHPSPKGLSPAAIWLYRILNFPLNTLNAFWFYKMLTGAMKVLKAPSCAVTSEAHAIDDHKMQ